MVRDFFVSLFLFIFFSFNLYSSGFRLSEQSSKANGMGNAMTAIADDASVVWYNPAGMSFLKGNLVSLGTVMIYPSMKHNYNGGEDEISKVLHIPPYFFGVYKINEKFSAGLGYTVPFGLQTDWGLNSKTSKIATISDLVVNNYNLNLSYLLNEKISLGFGADYIYISKAVLNSKPNVEVKMSATGEGWGYNLSVFYKYDDNWNFGLNYRSNANVKVDGSVEYVGILKEKASTEINLPDTFQLGSSYKFRKWLFSFVLDRTNWSRYDKLVVKKSSGDITYYKRWKSVWAYRFGTEYDYKDYLKLRAGFFYDKNPVPEKHFESRTPDSDRIAFSLGLGWIKNNISMDFSYSYILFIKRKIDSSVEDDLFANALNGEYKSFAHMPSLGINYKF